MVGNAHHNFYRSLAIASPEKIDRIANNSTAVTNPVCSAIACFNCAVAMASSNASSLVESSELTIAATGLP